jgi:hypothetical protein
MANEAKDTPGLTWHGIDLPRVSPGNYQAVCIGWQGPEWVRAFRRWSLRLEFSLMDDGTLISAFFNMGSDENEPHIGRRSRFYAAWSLANGDAPRKGQKMTPEVFTEPGLLYSIHVADATKNEKNAAKPEALIYSRVTDILRIDRPNHLIFQSINQESSKQRYTQSTNQLIKKASVRNSSETLHESLQVSPVAGRRSEHPKDSNHKGRKAIASASGINGFSVECLPAIPDNSNGFIARFGCAHETAIAGKNLADSIDRKPRLVVKRRNHTRAGALSKNALPSSDVVVENSAQMVFQFDTR